MHKDSFRDSSLKEWLEKSLQTIKSAADANASGHSWFGAKYALLRILESILGRCSNRDAGQYAANEIFDVFGIDGKREDMHIFKTLARGLSASEPLTAREASDIIRYFHLPKPAKKENLLGFAEEAYRLLQKSKALLDDTPSL